MKLYSKPCSYLIDFKWQPFWFIVIYEAWKPKAVKLKIYSLWQRRLWYTVICMENASKCYHLFINLQAYHDGWFVQFYFGLPPSQGGNCLGIPIYHKYKVLHRLSEYLERFDLRTCPCHDSFPSFKEVLGTGFNHLCSCYYYRQS
jgi:hypothetical protein